VDSLNLFTLAKFFNHFYSGKFKQLSQKLYPTPIIFGCIIVDKLGRAGFTLSGALFRKNVGALQLGRQTLFSWEKTGDLF